MSLHCFHIPARTPEPAQSELNAFLAGHRVLAVQREWLADGAHSGWAFCVEVANGPGTLPSALKVDGAGASRGPRGQDVDYKQVLGEADFAVFARLRAVRKQMAQADGVPVYAVASNEQLAALAAQGLSTQYIDVPAHRIGASLPWLRHAASSPAGHGKRGARVSGEVHAPVHEARAAG
ncbi:MAG: hypothetical protein RL722_379 [Pseudomonadota bacterium]|jgi:hypothetical protein